MLMEVIHILDHAPIGAARDSHKVEHRYVLHHFTQPDPAGVGAHSDPKLGRQEQHRNVLIESANSGGVELQDG